MKANKRAKRPFVAAAGARSFTHQPADRAGRRYFTPKELAGELVAEGLTASERSITRRCHLPAGHPLRIATNPHFGRLHIPASELARLLGAEASA